ncbi:ABC transporter permease [Defluviimonas sp. WL0024]|uniref:ABC transporter permease n=1 Tax=Albidovulum salinarum TaxID=2984153 RepID=A0ABT2X837_9RHOB|nr:ABC transporter permease [Defluviimonas sp. WL0024]MCU9849142.1 ABC transporter permease [Defluviimonas sp. WL0024]
MEAAHRSPGFRRWFNRRGWIKITIATPYVWLSLFFLLPFVIVIAMSFATRTPTAPPFSFGGDYPVLNTNHYARLIHDDLYVRAYLNSIGNATLATLMCLLIGYPMALGLTRVSRSWRNVLLMLVILPFWTSFLLRVYAWMGLMGTNSWFNKLLTGAYNWVMPADMALRYIPMMNTGFAVVLVTVYSYLPFMILPLYANLEKLDLSLNEAAMDLGSRPFQVFRDVTLPLSLPGIIAGSLLVFIPASGELIIPSLVGSSSRPMIGRVISDEFASARDWPMASAVAVALLLLLVGPLMAYTYFEGKSLEKKKAEGES